MEGLPPSTRPMHDPADQYADHGPYAPDPAPYQATAGAYPGPDIRSDPRPGRLYDANATSDERLFALFEHLSYFCWLVGIPGIVVTLILWLIKKNDSPFIDDHGREALNMHLSVILYAIAAIPIGILTCGVLWFVSLVVPVVAMVFAILAAIAAHRGAYYRYPATIRFF